MVQLRRPFARSASTVQYTSITCMYAMRRQLFLSPILASKAEYNPRLNNWYWAVTSGNVANILLLALMGFARS